jgi:hypothetical protein
VQVQAGLHHGHDGELRDRETRSLQPPAFVPVVRVHVHLRALSCCWDTFLDTFLCSLNKAVLAAYYRTLTRRAGSRALPQRVFLDIVYSAQTLFMTVNTRQVLGDGGRVLDRDTKVASAVNAKRSSIGFVHLRKRKLSLETCLVTFVYLPGEHGS